MALRQTVSVRLQGRHGRAHLESLDKGHDLKLGAKEDLGIFTPCQALAND